MHYGNNKPKYVRFLIYALLIAGAALIQNSPYIIPEIFGARAFILLPVCVSIAMFEREIAAAVFGVFAGVLWDICIGKDGFNAFVLILIGAVCSLLISHFMRNNILTALVLGVGSVVSYCIIYVVVNLIFGGAGASVGQLFTFYLPSGIYTAVFIPVFYFPVSWIYNSHKTADE
ncbi:MAG: rod shape-determining protein MreD [Clostridia bacterium]|nr:rod shape-determining protein MreD [Clostridia bacterium]